MKRLRQLWNRVAHCALGDHRETIECTGGSALRRRCLDCDHREFVGWVFRWGSNKRHTLKPWEHPDA